MTRQRSVERSELVFQRATLLAETMPHVAHPPIRNRGTLGGNAVHADPASELPAVMLALQASCRVRGPNGERWIPVEDFFLGLFGTSLEPDELKQTRSHTDCQEEPKQDQQFAVPCSVEQPPVDRTGQHNSQHDWDGPNRGHLAF